MGRFLVSFIAVLFERLYGLLAGSLSAICAGWNRFWFAAVDPTILGIIRLFVGGMLLYTHLVWTLRLEAFFGPDGWQSLELMQLYQQNEHIYSLWYYVPHEYMWTAHWACIGILFCYWIGFLTPITKWLAFAITISYAHRAQMANFGLDQINAVCAFYLALGPCGARLSVDRWIKNWWARGKGFKQAQLPASTSANLSLRLMQVHLCVIYTFAGISKLQGELWWNGFAVWNTAANLEYQSNSLLWLANATWLCQLLTQATIFWEISFWALVWNRTLRPYVLLIGAGMHLGIGGFLGMWTFGLIMIFMYLSFIPPEYANSILQFFPNAIRDAKRRATGKESSSKVSTKPVAAIPLTARPEEQRILIIDERLQELNGLRQQISQLGYPCESTADFETARTLLSTQDFAAVVVGLGYLQMMQVDPFRNQLIEAAGPASLLLVPQHRGEKVRPTEYMGHRVIQNAGPEDVSHWLEVVIEEQYENQFMRKQSKLVTKM